LLIGSTAFGLLVWSGARTSARTARWVWAGWTATFIGSVGGLLLYGPYASGLGLGDITQTGLLGDTLDTSFGQVWLARVVLLVGTVPVLRALLSRRSATPRPVARPLLLVAAALSVLLAATPGLSGHAVTGDWVTVAVIADTVHVLAMAVWLGGLAVLANVLLPGRPAAEVREPLTRWSLVALLSVVAIVVSGGFQTWRQVGSIDALRSTDYGRMLIVKLIVFAALVAVAAFSREIVLRLFPAGPDDLDPVDAGATESGDVRERVPVLTGGSDDAPLDRAAYADHSNDRYDDDDYEVDEHIELRNLRRAVWIEVAAAVAILAVTALLVNAAPAKTAFAGNFASNAVGVTLKANKIWVDITITPGRKGANDVHISTVQPDGAPKDVQDLTITFALPSDKIAPIKVPLRKLGPGHYLAPGFVVPINGTWRVTAKVLLSQFNLVSISDDLGVGGQ
jgi:copper transport protein